MSFATNSVSYVGSQQHHSPAPKGGSYKSSRTKRRELIDKPTTTAAFHQYTILLHYLTFWPIPDEASEF